jgi:hypothetical protein
VNLSKFGAILSLDAQVLNAQRCAALTDGKVYPRIMQHPPGVIALEHARLATEELGVEVNALIQIAH